MNNILKGWDPARIIRLTVGVGFGIYAVASKDYIFLWLTGLLLFQALLNISCCGGGGCSSSTTAATGEVYKDVIKRYKPERKGDN